MVEYAGQSISHTVVAAGVVAALLGLWRVGEPDLRVAFRLLPLLFPALVLPGLLVLTPERSAEAFRDRWALFAGERWAELEVGDAGVGRVALAALALLGLGLLLVDLTRILSERREARAARGRLSGERTPEIAPGRCADAPGWCADAPGRCADAPGFEEVARALGAPVPRLVVIDTAAPVLFVAGVRRPTLVISRGALDRLDGPERRAALAHEVAHVARRDPLLGWVLMALRLALWFNPAVQIVVRLVARELEWRADDLAAASTGDREALASALTKLSGAPDAEPRSARDRARAPWRSVDLFRRGRAAAVAARCARLLGPERPGPGAFGPLRLGMTAVALALLLFFVV